MPCAHTHIRALRSNGLSRPQAVSNQGIIFFKGLLCETSRLLSPDTEAAKHGIRRDSHGNLPVLCLSEDRDTLHCLLTAIYPTDIIYPATFETMMRTFIATRKYGMPSTLNLFRTYCYHVAPVVTTDNAFRAYVFAFNEGLKEEALEAAQLTLSLPQTFETYGLDLRIASGPALQALWRHRKVALEAVEIGIQQCVEDLQDLRDFRSTSSNDKICCAKPEPGPRPRELLLLFTRRLMFDFAMMNFSDFVQMMSSQGGFKCSSCKSLMRFDLVRVFDCLERHVNGQMEQAHEKFLSLFDNPVDVLDPQPPNNQPRNFGAPFDRKDSDVTIRSCDQVDFHVHKPLLGMASVVFEDMFTAPGPSPPDQGRNIPVIALTEDSKTLHRLLTMMYPIDPDIPETIEDALSLLATCQKYQMDSAMAYIRALLKPCTPPLITTQNSFRAYGIASRFHLMDEAQLAAQLTLNRSMSFNACGEDLRFISGADLYRLLTYRAECTRVAMDCINQMKGVHDAPPSSRSCTGPVIIGKYDTEELQSVPRWWHGHFRFRIVDRPSPKTVTDRPAFERALASHRRSSGCSSCLGTDETRIDNTICATLEVKLNAAVEQVHLNTNPVGN
ncbi:hypothetical protein B0F90DRAFT_412836 [Multifurca ochricompacta]|uniref:BTB domain-containing protein n=1 Tax=Multifurca ochricompacta TaxID=376703 RepID=A0AAD4M5J1_9AGAM|nr:hypothetical protein B0F90DRAFT_412836 [Multifurca ochricompacta]